MLIRFKISKRFQDGFTGVDVLLSLALSSFMFLGMSYIFVDVTEKLRVEEIRSDVLKYGNTILNAIEKDMVQATKVECKEFKDKIYEITCFKDDVETVYSVDGVNGILKDGKPPEVFLHTDSGKASWLRYNSVNDKGQDLYSIYKFECKELKITDNTNDIENYIFDVKMEIDLYHTRRDEWGNLITVDEILFNRRIYAVNYYLKKAI